MAKFDPRKDADRAYLAAALTAYALGLRFEALLATGRGTPQESRARHIAMYLTHVGLGMSLARVARAFDRDRSTVSYACHVVEDARDDEAFDDLIEQLTLGLTSVVPLEAIASVA